MTDSVKVEIITRDFGRMLEELAAIDPRVEFRDVVITEALAVVGASLAGTKAAHVSSIRRNWEAKRFTTFNGKVYYLHNRYPDPLWGELAAWRGAHLNTKLAARGLAKGSWWFLSKLLGGSLSVPAYVPRANYRGRQFPENAAHSETGTGLAYTLQIINSSPIVQAAGGRRALLRGMARRTTYFRINMERRAFRSAESRARRYPGIFARPLAAA